MPIDYQKQIDALFSKSVLAHLAKIETTGTVTLRDGTSHYVVKHICVSKASAYFQFSAELPAFAVSRDNRCYNFDFDAAGRLVGLEISKLNDFS